jgi:hypothetical protein
MRLLGRAHPVVAMTLNTLAAFQADGGDAAGARRFQRRAVAIVKRAFGTRHPKTQIARENRVS